MGLHPFPTVSLRIAQILGANSTASDRPHRGQGSELSLTNAELGAGLVAFLGLREESPYPFQIQVAAAGPWLLVPPPIQS